MPVPIDPVHLELILKTMGIENFKEVTKELGEIRDKAKDLPSPIEQANQALLETSDVTQKLEKNIKDLEEELEKLKDSFKKGLIESEEEFLERAGDFQAEIVKHTKALELLNGEEDGGGLKGVASGALKLERAFAGLATGHGIRGATTALEGLIGMLGGPAGVGLAIGAVIQAIDSTLPKFDELMKKLDGTAKSAEMVANRIKEANEQMTKFKAQPTEEEKASMEAMKGVLAGRGGMQITQGIEDALRAQGYGISPEQAAILAAPGVSQLEKDIILRQQTESIRIQRARMMEGVMAGRPGAIGELTGMVGRFPGLFPGGAAERLTQALPENIERARRQAQTAEEQSMQAEEIYAQREKARQESVGIQAEFNKVRQQQEHERIEAVSKADERFARDWEESRKVRSKAAKDIAREHEKEAKEAAREAKKAAHEALPSTQLHVQRAALEEEALGYAGMALPGAGPDVQQKMARHMIENTNLGLALGHTLEEQINYAIMQTRRDIANGIAHGMKRNQMQSETFVPPQ
jgi:hypothetical protein